MITIPIRNITAPPELAEARQRPQRSDGHLQLDQGDLAAGHLIERETPAVPAARGHGCASRDGRPVPQQDGLGNGASRRVGWGVAACCAALGPSPAARAGHEISYYPSFYPQEIRIEALTPAAAAKEFANTTDPLHAYIGAAPQFAGKAPSFLKSAASLDCFHRRQVQSEGGAPAEPRCAVRGGRGCLRTAGDRARGRRRARLPDHALSCGLSGSRRPRPRRQAGDASGCPPAGAHCARQRRPRAAAGRQCRTRLPDQWDISFEEVSVADLLRQARVGADIWLAPPWAKEGWFQAYHLLRSAVSDPARAERADTLYERHDARRVQGQGRAVQSRARSGGGPDARLRARRRRLPAAPRVLQRRVLQRHREHRQRFPIRVQLGRRDPHHEAQGLSLERLAAPGHRRPGGGRLESGRGLHRRDRPPRLVDGRRRRVSPHHPQQPLGAEPRRAPSRRGGSQAQSVDAGTGRCADAGGTQRQARPRRRGQGRGRQAHLQARGFRFPGRHGDGACRSPLPLRARLPLGRGRGRTGPPSTPTSPPRRRCCAHVSPECASFASRSARCSSPTSRSTIAARSPRCISTASPPTTRRTR